VQSLPPQPLRYCAHRDRAHVTGPSLAPADLLRVQDGAATAIISALIERREYDREFAHGLLDKARDPAADWGVRRVAVLALEHQLLLLDSAATDEFVPLLARLGFTPAPGGPCRADVFKQGYTTREPRSFVLQLTSRLARLAPVHEPLRCADVSLRAIAHFEHISTQECLLTLARSAFSPEEVVAQILQHVRLAGAQIASLDHVAHFTDENARATANLPEYEAEILARLLGIANSWWVGPTTGSAFNALVSCPVGTLALVIRPPGSTVEFEIKRVGLRGPHPLTVVFEKRRAPVPPAHRLHGGSAFAILQWEAEHGARLSYLYRALYDQPAPIGRVVQLCSIKSVPRPNGGDAPLPAWFDDPAMFGDGFDAMRRAITRSLAAFVDEETEIASVPRSAEARTRVFLGHVTPAQGILLGTSALRLDRVDGWLRGDGLKEYFELTQGRIPTLDESCRFADAILREVLSPYRPPAPTASYSSYVAAAFADAENRAAADRSFRAAVASMGKLWGTLLGLGSYTDGESFVARNVGLRAVWANGTWSTEIVFMDHESTHMIANGRREFGSQRALPAIYGDWIQIMGTDPGRRPRRGSLAVLADIYRVDSALRVEGRIAIVDEMRRAYRFTFGRMRDDANMRANFRDSFLNSLLAWDAAVGIYRASRVSVGGRAQWKGRVRRMMSAYGLAEPLIQQYRRTIRRHARLLRRCPYLFCANDGV
jgi:hypothetical protein